MILFRTGCAALALIASGQVDVKPFISRTFAFEDGIRAFEEAAAGRATDVKIQIEFPLEA